MSDLIKIEFTRGELELIQGWGSYTKFDPDGEWEQIDENLYLKIINQLLTEGQCFS